MLTLMRTHAPPLQALRLLIPCCLRCGKEQEGLECAQAWLEKHKQGGSAAGPCSPSTGAFWQMWQLMLRARVACKVMKGQLERQGAALLCIMWWHKKGEGALDAGKVHVDPVQSTLQRRTAPPWQRSVPVVPSS